MTAYCNLLGFTDCLLFILAFFLQELAGRWPFAVQLCDEMQQLGMPRLGIEGIFTVGPAVVQIDHVIYNVHNGVHKGYEPQTNLASSCCLGYLRTVGSCMAQTKGYQRSTSFLILRRNGCLSLAGLPGQLEKGGGCLREMIPNLLNLRS